MDDSILDSKPALPNKLMQEDGTITDITGAPITETVDEYDAKPALPNKFLNADGSYSTLNEIIASMVDTSIFVIVNELPESGDPEKIYLVPDGDGGFLEYHYVDGIWDEIGAIATDVSLQVFYWDGTTIGDGITFWNNLLEINKTTDIIVFARLYATVSNHVAYIPINTLHNNGSTSNVRFIPNQPVIQDNYSNLGYTHADFGYITYRFIKNNNLITSITYSTNSRYSQYLDPSVNYSNVYTPQYPGSPATKKYVDDLVGDIENVLEDLDIGGGVQ